jgi:hypothetical protein
MAEYAVAIAVAGVVIAVAGAGVATYSAVQQAETQKKLAKSEKKQREIEADAVRESAKFEERQARRRLMLVRGENQAAFAAAGFETTSGTPLVQDIDLVTQGELDALNIRRAGEMSATTSIYESNVAGFRAQAAERSIPLSIAGGVLSAGSGAVSAYQQTNYYQARKKTLTTDMSGRRYA